MNYRKFIACCMAACTAIAPASGTAFAAESSNKDVEIVEKENSDATSSKDVEDDSVLLSTANVTEAERASVDSPDVTDEQEPDVKEGTISKEEDMAGVMGESVEIESTDEILLKPAASGYTTTNWGTTRYHRNSDIEGKAMVKVVDISKWNGTVDFNKLKSQGIEGVILRIAVQGYGSAGTLSKDTYFETNYKKAKDAGLKVGVYIYTEALNSSEALTQANYVLNILNGRSLELPVVFDYENSSASGDRIKKYGLSRTTGTNAALAFLDKVKSSGYEGMIYFSPSFEVSHVNGYTIADKGYLIWLARYNTYAVTKSSHPSWYDGRIDMWQFSSTVKVSGTSGNSGNIDANYFYDPITVQLSSPKSASNNSIDIGKTIKATAKSSTKHFGSYSEGYSYTSSNTSVATVDGNGNVKGIKAGTAKITVKGKTSGQSDTFTVTVKSATPVATISDNGGSGKDTAGNNDSKTNQPTTPKVDFTSLAAPSIKVSSASGSQIVLSWNAVSNAPTYIVCRSESPNGTFKKIGQTTDKSYTDKSVTTNKEYYYKIYSSKKNNVGKTIESKWSNMVTYSAKATQNSTINQIKTKVALNMRSNPGTNYSIITTIPSGKVVNVIANTKDIKGNAWLKVTYNGKTGYVYSSTAYLQNYTATTTKTMTTTGNLNMRSGAGTGYKIVTTIPKGKKVTALSNKKVSGVTWYKVTYSGKTGWCSGKYLK